MEIIKREFDEIEYYLVDIYDDEFPFGTVYHFTSGISQKYCFYQDNMYIPIENKKYLKQIKQKLEFCSNIIYNKINIKKKIIHILTTNILSKRLEPEEEYKLCDKVAKTITELYPNISYEDTMKVLYNDSGIYYSKLPNNTRGNYNTINDEIYLNSDYKNSEDPFDIELHEAIHKLTNRNGFIKDNMDYIGLIEAGTAKICENKHVDKTSHEIFGGDNEIHVNFSNSSSYQLEQVIYRQMTQLVDGHMADEELINGSFDIFLNKFEKMYGKDLLLYLSHITKRLALHPNLPEKKQLNYLKQAQDMLLTRVFDKKLLDVKTEEDMINYMAELKNFEYTRARMKNDYTFEDYYIDKYNYIMELARKRGMNTSRLEEFEYSPVEFLPVKNNPEVTFSEITQRHIEKICHNQSEKLLNGQKLDLEKCTRIQINNFPNSYCVDIVLQNGLPISAIDGIKSNDISVHDKGSSIYKSLGVNRNKAEIYVIADGTYMVVNNDGTFETYSISYETSKIYKGIEKQVDLGFTLEDIEEYETEIKRNDTHSFIHKFRNFFNNLFHRKSILTLPDDTVTKQSNSTDNPNKNRKSFLNQLNPNNNFYEDRSVTLPENSKTDSGKIAKINLNTRE